LLDNQQIISKEFMDRGFNRVSMIKETRDNMLRVGYLKGH